MFRRGRSESNKTAAQRQTMSVRQTNSFDSKSKVPYRVVVGAEELVLVDAEDHVADGESGLDVLSFHQGERFGPLLDFDSGKQ